MTFDPSKNLEQNDEISAQPPTTDEKISDANVDAVDVDGAKNLRYGRAVAVSHELRKQEEEPPRGKKRKIEEVGISITDEFLAPAHLAETLTGEYEVAQKMKGDVGSLATKRPEVVKVRGESHIVGEKLAHRGSQKTHVNQSLRKTGNPLLLEVSQDGLNALAPVGFVSSADFVDENVAGSIQKREEGIESLKINSTINSEEERFSQYRRKYDSLPHQDPGEAASKTQEKSQQDQGLSHTLPPVDPALHPPSRLIGTLLSGRFQIQKVLSMGGMGVIYLAEQLSTKQLVALKVLHPGVIECTETANERFALEIRILAQLTHPHIVSLIDCGLTQDGWPYFVEQYIPGVSLTQYLKQKPMPLERALDIWAQVSSALGYAHARNICHRDVKSDNIMVAQYPNQHVHCTLIDFGVAKSSDEPLEITKPGMVAGTLAGIAPEILRGDAATPQSDLFSLGVMIFQMLTGHLPCEANNPIRRLEFYESTFACDLRDKLPSDLPDALVDLVLELLTFEVSARPRRAYDVERRLENISRHLTETQRLTPLQEFSPADETCEGRLKGLEDGSSIAKKLRNRISRQTLNPPQVSLEVAEKERTDDIGADLTTDMPRQELPYTSILGGMSVLIILLSILCCYLVFKIMTLQT